MTRIVMLGAGMIAEVHRRAALLAGGEIIGVLAADAQQTTNAADRWRTAALTGLRDLVSVEPDVVHVCSPNTFHVEHVKAALEAGAHVICEKPLATNTADAEALVELAAAKRRVAAVPFVYRFHPLVRELRARAQSGEFGPWQLLHGSYLQDWLVSPLASSWRVDAKLGGTSRAFADIGSHWCDLMEFVTGERIASVMAAFTTTVAERPAMAAATFTGTSSVGNLVKVDTEDAAAVLFRTHSGVLGSVVISQVSAGRKNRLWFEFDGALQSAVFDQENPETAWLGTEEGAFILNRSPNSGAADARRLSSLPSGHSQGYAQCFDNFIADTYAAVHGRVPNGLPTFSDGLRSTRIVDAVIASSRSKIWVDVKDKT